MCPQIKKTAGHHRPCGAIVLACLWISLAPSRVVAVETACAFALVTRGEGLLLQARSKPDARWNGESFQLVEAPS